MLFVLSNASSIFMWTIRQVFRLHIGKKFTVYFDDILTFNTIMEEHVRTLRVVLDTHREKGFFFNNKKVVF